jgi:hypothetical protein
MAKSTTDQELSYALTVVKEMSESFLHGRWEDAELQSAYIEVKKIYNYLPAVNDLKPLPMPRLCAFLDNEGNDPVMELHEAISVIEETVSITDNAIGVVRRHCSTHLLGAPERQVSLLKLPLLEFIAYVACLMWTIDQHLALDEDNALKMWYDRHDNSRRISRNPEHHSKVQQCGKVLENLYGRNKVRIWPQPPRFHAKVAPKYWPKVKQERTITFKNAIILIAIIMLLFFYVFVCVRVCSYGYTLYVRQVA